MAIPLTGTGGLFTRMGKFIYALNSLNAYLGSSTFAGLTSIGQSQTAINNQFLATDQNVIDGLYNLVAQVRAGQATWETGLQNLAQATVIEMANDDTPLAVQDLPHALNVLIAQMGAATASVNQPTTSAGAPTALQANGNANSGNGVMAVSVLSYNGGTLDYIFNEKVTAICTQDSQSGTSLRQEQFTLTTPVAAGDILGFQYPLGSGVSQTTTVVDPTENNAGGNLLTNSDFETSVNTPNVPDNWTLASGTPGTDILATAASINTGVYGLGCFEFVANSSSSPAITQAFNSVGGTGAVLAPNTIYPVAIWGQKNGSASVGTLAMSLVNSGGTVINDDSGAANTITLAEASMSSASFTAVTGFFRTPSVLATGYKMKVYTSVSLGGTGGTIYYGGAAMAQGVPLYTQGPNVCFFAGPKPFYQPDQFVVQVNNNYGGAVQLGSDKFLNLRTNGFALPSSVSPTVPDSVVS